MRYNHYRWQNITMITKLWMKSIRETLIEHRRYKLIICNY
nr:MAG TPA: hypothetical protein [Caudoviricetes sp.]